MRDKFVAEAAQCRAEAEYYAGRPEQPFLLRVAREFERLGELVTQKSNGAAAPSNS